MERSVEKAKIFVVVLNYDALSSFQSPIFLSVYAKKKYMDIVSIVKLPIWIRININIVRDTC